MMNPTNPATGERLEFISMGCLCAMLTRLPKAIQRAAAELNISPTTINGLWHFTPDQAERIRGYFLDKPPFAWSNDSNLRRRRLGPKNKTRRDDPQ